MGFEEFIGLGMGKTRGFEFGVLGALASGEFGNWAGSIAFARRCRFQEPCWSRLRVPYVLIFSMAVSILPPILPCKSNWMLPTSHVL